MNQSFDHIILSPLFVLSIELLYLGIFINFLRKVLTHIIYDDKVVEDNNIVIHIEHVQPKTWSQTKPKPCITFSHGDMIQAWVGPHIPSHGVLVNPNSIVNVITKRNIFDKNLEMDFYYKFLCMDLNLQLLSLSSSWLYLSFYRS